MALVRGVAGFFAVDALLLAPVAVGALLAAVGRPRRRARGRHRGGCGYGA